jgi:hypothetical protein
LSSYYWIDNLGFITEGKLAAIFIKTFSWGFPTGWSSTTHSRVNLVPEVFLSPLPCIKEEAFTSSSPCHQQVFSGAVAGEEEDFCKGSFHTHILYFVLSSALLYFYLHRFIKNPKKLVSFVVVFTCMLLVC